MEDTVSFKDILQLLKKRILLILSVTLIAGLTSGLISYFYLTPIYQSSTKLLINQINEDERPFTSNEIQVQANLQLIDTYHEIIKSSHILGKVSEELNSTITIEELSEQITIEKSENSQVVTINVKDADATRAAAIADSIGTIFEDEIKEIMNVNNVKILDEPIVNLEPVEPNKLLNIVLALVIGLITGVGLAFLLDYLDNTVKSEQDIEKELGLTVIGSVSIIRDGGKVKRKKRKSAHHSRVRGGNLGT